MLSEDQFTFSKGSMNSRYEPYLYSQFRHNNSGQLLPSSEVTSSSDTILTGLAQLGVYQTATERSFVSLFDQNYQYVVAETVPSMSLTPNLPSEECPSPLSLCGTAIPRSHGTCEHVLYVSDGNEQNQTDLPLSFVPNLVTDERFHERPYCQFGETGQFYAAVPIRTRRGINIGSYCVLSATMPDGWGDHCTRYLRDTSRAIMEHLEANRSKHAYRRNERMNRGLGSFIEGKSTISGWQSSFKTDAFTDNSGFEGSLNSTQQRSEQQSQDAADKQQDCQSVASIEVGSDGLQAARLKGIPEAHSRNESKDSSRDLQKPNFLNSTNTIKSMSQGSADADVIHVFSKSANIIREAFEVAGCLFFDVSVGSYSITKVHSPAGEKTAASGNQHSTSGSDEPDPESVPLLRREVSTDMACKVLGFSTSDEASIDGQWLPGGEGIIPRQFLAKLLRRYPRGNIFSFDASGELQSSDSSEDETRRVATDDLSSNQPQDSEDNSSSYVTAVRRKQAARRFSRIREGAIVQRAFPNARSVAFAPVWDSKRERWIAGGFIYTRNPARLFTIEGELSFLMAFAKLTAAELQGLEIQRADQAKSDVLGSLSHELRSPLHGVIFGTELLNDTDLSVFQGNATHTIETCCRTLLDTIDHLLDYAKINSFAARAKHESDQIAPHLRQKAKVDGFGKKDLYASTRLDGLVEEVTESMFAGFNFQRKSVRQLVQKYKPEHADALAHRQLDVAQAMEQLGLASGDEALHIGRVSVFVDVDPNCDWMFHVQAGALRRIIMNLVGNSLKYTQDGLIKVSLTQMPIAGRASRAELPVRVTVQDTGNGISEDYLQHRLFKPFTQENELASGTGLGLSLVKRIVSQLRGQIAVESRIGVGTTVRVTLPLKQSLRATSTHKEDAEFDEYVQEITGLRIKLIGFHQHATNASTIGRRDMVESICRNSLHVDLVPKQQAAQTLPDLLLCSDDAHSDDFLSTERLSKVPCVVICQDALVAYHLHIKFGSASESGVLEVISQP
jgi:signal transduction histidine kinase